jgi:HAD superfamily hydrolase (TIGR01459 family)
VRVEHLSAIADRFDGMIIDQFGVLHDGQSLYPGTLDVLRGLQASRIPVVVVTNSGKRVESNRQRLLDIGIPRDTFVDVVTSGEIAWEALRTGAAESHVPGMLRMTGMTRMTRMTSMADRAPRAYVIGKPGDDYRFDGVPLVDDPRDADVLLILSSDAPRTSLDAYRERLADVTVPAICCNPDRWMLTPTGLQPGPGAIAAMYADMGRSVTWIGKPYPAIYQTAALLLGNASRVLCIGDSAEHDVAGGRAAGFDTMIVMTGVSHGLDAGSLDPLPDYWMETFTW